MRRSLRDANTAFSLFAFQDIIFSVTAVLLFATIWFALSTKVQRFTSEQDRAAPQELAQQIERIAKLEMKAELPAAVPDDTVESAWVTWREQNRTVESVSVDTRRTTGEMEQRAAQAVRELQSEAARGQVVNEAIVAAQAAAREALVRAPAREAQRELVLIVVSAQEVTVENARGELTRWQPGPGATADLWQDLLARSDPEREYLAVLLRPSAASLYAALARQLEGRGFAFSLEPVDETQLVQRYSVERARALLESGR